MSEALESLAKLSERSIQRDLKRLGEERRRIEFQENLLQQVLELKRSLPQQAGDATAKNPSRQPSKRDAVLAIMRDEPSRTWFPRDMTAALKSRGIAASGNAVQVMLLRMLDAEQLARDESGGYRLPQGDKQLESQIGAHSDADSGSPKNEGKDPLITGRRPSVGGYEIPGVS